MFRIEQECRFASQNVERVTAKKGGAGGRRDCRPKCRFGVSDHAFYCGQRGAASMFQDQAEATRCLCGSSLASGLACSDRACVCS